MYFYYIIGIAFIIYTIVDFKKKPNNSAFNRYYNSKYYRVVIFVLFAIIAFIISLFTKRN